MIIKEIKLQNFRNYEDIEMEFDNSRNIVIGENAQGKTNLIEAVYLCAFAKSFRTNNAAELVRFNEDIGRVNVLIESEDIEKSINIAINNKGKKMISKDGKVIRATTELLNNLVVIIFSPEDLRIIKDDPERRRSFLNKEISQIRPRYYEQLRKYNEALKQKNAILKADNRRFDESILDIYDQQLAAAGYEVIRYRREFTEKLSHRAAEIQGAISDNRENLTIRYKETISPSNSEDMYNEIVMDLDKDIYNGHAGRGPHRDDLVFYINEKDAKKYGSQGQQRTIALSLKLAEVKLAQDILDEAPILLLDDVLSELDIERQRFLINEIDDVQLFITSTEVNEEIMERMRNGSVYKVQNGNIVQIERR